MNNKLVPIIIDNPCQKGWAYRTRDTIITLATLALWVLVIVRMYMFFVVEEAILDQLYSSVMIKVVLIGFVVTFLTFHCWAVYNQFLYTRYLRRQLRIFQQPTLATEQEMGSDMEDLIEKGQMHEQDELAISNQASN